VSYRSLLQFLLFGNILAHAFNAFGIEAVEFPAVRFPKVPREEDNGEPWDYKLWGLTLGMTSEILAAGGHPGIPLESNSCASSLSLFLFCFV
jgi:hypothetical protein